jgi:xanthine dehydrogenase YagR molybdenum-binding subunit
MPDEKYNWPPAEKRKQIGKRISRVDGPQKSSGRARYTYDYNPKDLLYGAMVGCPHPHAKVVSVDTSEAEKMAGVKAVQVIQGPGREIQWAGDPVVAVAAVDEHTAQDAAALIKVQYEQLPHLVIDSKEPPHEIPPDTSPLSQSDLQDMASNQVPEAQVVAAVQQRGITFKPDDAMLQRVPPAIADALRKAEQKPPENKPPSWYKPSLATTTGDPDKAFSEAEVTSEGMYGSSVMTHCCLESHGSVSEWPDEQNLTLHISTQNVSGSAGQMARPLNMPATNIHVHQDHIGGGFGSKFAVDRWDVTAAQLSKKAGGKPVKIMLTRAQELEFAGCRPSAYARVKVAATKDGRIMAWESFGWGTGGPGGGGSPPLPYLMADTVPNQRRKWTAVVNNIGPARAWRAPAHPQAAVITICAFDDLAAKLNMNPVDFWLKNIELTGARSKYYKDEFPIADKLMNWSARWHPRGDKTPGSVKQGLGVSLHTWGGRGHASECDLTINGDGSVEIKMGTQDLGTGTRTCIMAVAADTLGLPLENIRLLIGDNKYPVSGPSGGSSTIGGVSSSTRRASVDARDALFAKVAPALDAKPEELEAVDGVVRVASAPTRKLTWKEACAKIGALPITAHGKNGPGMTPDLTNSNVGGVQMADVSVDIETGVVKINKMVAVQDCGLVIDLKTAESQVLGALIMGVGYSLYEEKIMDPTSGRMLNPNMEFYRLAGIGDVGDLVVHMMTGPGNDERGVIGLGEPPTVSPGAAISNAVANAIGVRVSTLPLTPTRVLAALEGAEKGASA